MSKMTRIGTPYYVAPEIIQGKQYNNKVDIWSCGCVLYYLSSDRVPFSSSNLLNLGKQIVNA